MGKFQNVAIIKTSWEQLHAAKGVIWLSLFLLLGAEIAITLVITVIQLLFTSLYKPNLFFFLSVYLILIPMLAPFLTIPLQLGIKKVKGEERLFSNSVLGCFSHYFKLYITLLFIIFVSVLILVGTIASMLPLLISSPLAHVVQIKNQQIIFQQITWTLPVLRTALYLTGIFFAGLSLLSYVILFVMFSLPLIVNKNLNPPQAICQSCKMVGKAWIRLSILFFFVLPVIWIGIQIPVYAGDLIGGWIRLVGWVATLLLSIWFIPYSFVLYGATYQVLIGKGSSS